MSDQPSTISNTPRQQADQWDDRKLRLVPSPPAHSPLLRLNPLPTADAVGHLSRCLALCAPSGMSVDDRTEWLSAALEDMDEIPGEIFLEACRVARRTCDHPSKIMPTVCGYADREMPEFRRMIARACEPKLVCLPAEPAPVREPLPPIDQAAVDAMNPTLIKIGLGCGALVRNADGSISPAPEDAA